MSIKKKAVFIILFVSLIGNAFAIFHFVSFNHSKTNKIKKEIIVPENIVFLGDSITDLWNLDKYFPDNHVVNSGINGNITDDILKDMNNRVYQYNPSKVFILIGTNDTTIARSNLKIVDNIFEIIDDIKKNRPYAKIYVESIYPINNTNNSKINHNIVGKRSNDRIKIINSMIEKRAKEDNVTYINVYDKLTDKNGNLDISYTKEGLHISNKGYEAIKKELLKYF